MIAGISLLSFKYTNNWICKNSDNCILVGYGDDSYVQALQFPPELKQKSETKLGEKIWFNLDFTWHTWSAKICRCDCASSSSLWTCCLAKSWINHHQPKFYLHAMHETNYSKDVPISKHPFILKRTLCNWYWVSQEIVHLHWRTIVIQFFWK